MRRGAIVLCGGQSRRMGRPKALLPFGAETMLQRVVRRVAEAVERVVVVAAPEQELPSLPAEVVVVRDAREAQGPLEGLAAGLRAMQEEVDAVFVTSCDAPLLLPAFVSRMFELLGEHDIAAPVADERFQPLAAVYRVSVLSHVEILLRGEQRRLLTLLEESDTRAVRAESLRDVDPELASLENLNHPEAYRAALRREGLGDR